MAKTASITKAQIVRAVSAARAIDPRQVVEIELQSGAVLRFPELRKPDQTETSQHLEAESWERAFD